MSVDTLSPAPAAAVPRLPLALRLAVRESKGALLSFAILIACIALGVAVITSVGALSDALRAGFERQGMALLGGDVALARSHARATPEERAFLVQRGALSETATVRAMARRTDDGEQTLVEIKAVDAAYPLAGEAKVAAGGSFRAALEGAGRAIVEPILLDRLGVRVGDRIRLGKIDVEIAATILSEPDKINDRLSYGPRVMVALDTLLASGLAEPGSLVRWRYALRLAGPEGADPAVLKAFREEVSGKLASSGFIVTDRRNPNPQVTRTLDRLRQFLTLVGLTALLVGGVGVANAIATYMDRRRRVIATFKSLGASGGFILQMHLAQVMMMAAIGVAIGITVGLAVPIALDTLLAGALPMPIRLAVAPRSLLLAAGYGLLVTLLFALWPLGRAGRVRAGVLFRDEVAPGEARPPAGVVVLTVVAGLALIGLALVTSDDRRIALYFCLGLAATLLVFLGLGTLITRLARRMRRPRQPELRLAIANLGAPGGLTRSVVLSLGSGLSVLVALAVADASIRDELTTRLPKGSPNYFVLDLPRSEREDFETLVRRFAPRAEIRHAPMLRGRLVKLGDRPAETVKAPPKSQWVLSGDRGLTYADTIPEGSRIVAGSWWPADWNGEPLVSFEADIARDLGLKVGDLVTVNVLGRDITARISNLREVRWESLAINFVMVLSPNALRAAPHNLLATISLPPDFLLSAEAQIAREAVRAHPATTFIRVKDAINAFQALFGRIMMAVRVAGGVTLVAGALVLAGALATAQRRRVQQAVVLKVLGATRRRVIGAHLAEYALLAIVTGIVAVVIGVMAAWAALTFVMDVPLLLSWRPIVEALGLSLLLVAVLGAIGTRAVLSTRTTPHLRAQ